jgi:hypothetical protein
MSAGGQENFSVDFKDQIIQAAAKKIIYSAHAVDEMNAENELITTAEVRHVILHGEIIEDYPEDRRGHSCLIFGMPEDRRPVHVVCAPKDDYLAIITAYIPTLDKWEPGYSKRRQK